MMRVRTSSVKTSDPPAQAHQGINVLLDVWSVSRAASGLLNAALAPSGLSADEFAVYSLLARQGPLTPSELAEQMATAPTTISSYVSRFERRGHVRREPHQRDGRSYRIRLTPSGRRTHRSAAEMFLPVLQGVVEALGPAEPEVRAALGKLRASMDRVRANRADAEAEPPPRAPESPTDQPRSPEPPEG